MANRVKGVKYRNTGGSAKGGKQFARLTMEEDTLTPSLQALPKVVDGIIGLTMNYYEPRVENWMKTEAPWTDRTTNARNGLAARSGRSKDVHWLVAFHQVPYGIFLETMQAGKYAIVIPAIEEFGPQIMKTFQGILDKRFPGGVS